MSDSSQPEPANALYALAAVGGVLLGAFLLAGAFGHFAAVWPAIGDATGIGRRFGLLFPGTVLLVTGVVNLSLCVALWKRLRWSLSPGLVINALAMIYLAYLLYSDVVPDHPIGIFLVLVSSYVLLLGAIRLGMVWPASGRQSADDH